MREHDAQGLDCRTQHQPHTQCATKPLHRLQWCRQLHVFIFLGSRNEIPSSLDLPAVADGRERKREDNQEQYRKHNRAGRLPGLAGDTVVGAVKEVLLFTTLAHRTCVPVIAASRIPVGSRTAALWITLESKAVAR